LQLKLCKELVPKKLNKGSSLRRLFLWYRRAAHSEEEEKRIMGLEILPQDVDVRKRLSLEHRGYRVVSNFSLGRFAPTSGISHPPASFPP